MQIVNGKKRFRISSTEYIVYALELNDNKFYIGVTAELEQRIKTHKKGGKSSSGWCKKHGFIRLIETFNTYTTNYVDACLIEDSVTLNYIVKYGSENVKGGIYLGSDYKRARQSELHLERGWISQTHKTQNKAI